MSTVRPGDTVYGCTEERKNKKNKILNCLFIYYIYIIVWVVKLLGVSGALGTELSLVVCWRISYSLADSSM